MTFLIIIFKSFSYDSDFEEKIYMAGLRISKGREGGYIVIK